MTPMQKKTVFTQNKLLLILPVLVILVFANMSLKLSASLWLCASEVGLMAGLMFCLCAYDLVRKVDFRPAIPFVWLCFGCGFGSLSAGLVLMAQNWSRSNHHKPIELVGLSLVVAFLFLIGGCLGFLRAVYQKAQESVN